MKESFNLKEDPFNEEKNKATKAHPFHSHKIGRNEPCPCGSGKKIQKNAVEKIWKKKQINKIFNFYVILNIWKI